METSIAISIMGIIVIFFVLIIAFFDICDLKKEKKLEDKKQQEQKIKKSESICPKENQPSLRQVIKLVKDFENGGREISRIHKIIRKNNTQDFDIALTEGQLALNVIRSRRNKKFRKDMEAINSRYGR
jgi:hypothetical protein